MWSRIFVLGTGSAISGTLKIAYFAQYLQFWGYQEWHSRSLERKSVTTIIDQVPPLDLEDITLETHFSHSFLAPLIISTAQAVL